MFDLSKWTRTEVIAALERGGYISNDIMSAKFAGVSQSGKAIFDIAYKDPDEPGGVGMGRVFVGIDKNGCLTGDY